MPGMMRNVERPFPIYFHCVMLLRIKIIRDNVQGYLDEQFIQLEELQDAANPNFVEEVVTMYYRDSARLIQNIDHAL